ncbi:YbhB/YbcL family Raf kinase inhibitor-like protein [Herbiconiux sp.]|uniref:YbhB/YbcL family Raf kinase inhibitor-like protein n=1 Tax=Herbiconiux sp. TaxID=1871186 RepID=UPI0025BEBEF2|nr:YbhB/YbcL family Raf kinase inhibitor-like protein [Herbiconiux sp.]
MPLFIDKLAISSPDFVNLERIPENFSADGGNDTPGIAISGAPEGTVEFALIVNDPDAPLANGFTHWVVYGIPADASTLDLSAEGVRVAPNGAGAAVYYGPQPPAGHGQHHYFFHLYALSTPVVGEPTREGFLASYADSIIEVARTVGTFSRD